MAAMKYYCPPIKKYMGPNDLHFTFNMFEGNRRMKCFDYSGRMIWQAFAQKSPMCQDIIITPNAVQHDAHVGSVNVMHHTVGVTEVHDKSVYCNNCSCGHDRVTEIGSDTTFTAYKLRFNEKGLYDDLWMKYLPGRQINMFDLEPADFAQLCMFVDGGRRCFLVVHYYE